MQFQMIYKYKWYKQSLKLFEGNRDTNISVFAVGKDFLNEH